jgi:hypothetical protein
LSKRTTKEPDDLSCHTNTLKKIRNILLPGEIFVIFRRFYFF